MTEPLNEARGAFSELTVGEYLDRAIAEAEDRARALRDLKGSMSQEGLDRGCSRLAHALQPPSYF